MCHQLHVYVIDQRLYFLGVLRPYGMKHRWRIYPVVEIPITRDPNAPTLHTRSLSETQHD
jgi:hypothetical protein